MNIIQFDTWTNLWNKQNQPLTGRLVFKDRDTKQNTDVYDNAGNSLGHIVYINGVTDYQVFLDTSHDYTAYLYEYIGSGSFRTDEDETNWLLIRSIDCIANPNGTTVATNDVIYGISSLKDIDTTSLAEGYTVAVTGYYTSDDCPTRYYKWQPKSTVTIDNGIVIGKENQTGRWILDIPSDYIDVRWYGDIPQDNESGTVYLAQRSLAAQAANSYSKNLYFPAGYYIFDGSNTVYTNANFVLDNRVYFYCKSSNKSYITCNEIISKYKNWNLLQTDGNENLVFFAKHVKTSWFEELSYCPVEQETTFIINEKWTRGWLTNTKFAVEPGTLVNAMKFDNCACVAGHHFIQEGCSFKNMTVDGIWFREMTNVSASNFSFSNCSFTDASTFLNKKLYVDFKNMTNDPNYGDLGNANIGDRALLNNAYISNFTCGTVTLQGSANIDKCHGKISLASTGTVSINESHVVIDGTGNVLNITNSTVYGSNDGQSGTFFAQVNLSNSNLSECAFVANGYLKMNDATVYKSNITVYPSSTSFVYSIDSCSFAESTLTENANGQTKLTREAKITNNSGFVLDDTSSNVVKLGTSFEWANNSDNIGIQSLTDVPYLGYDHDQTTVPPWADYNNAVYIRDNMNNKNTTDYGYATTTSESNNVFDTRMMFKITLTKPTAPFKYPANALYADMKLNVKYKDSIATEAVPLMVVRQFETTEQEAGVKYYTLQYCGKNGVPLKGNAVATMMTTWRINK